MDDTMLKALLAADMPPAQDPGFVMAVMLRANRTAPLPPRIGGDRGAGSGCDLLAGAGDAENRYVAGRPYLSPLYDIALAVAVTIGFHPGAALVR